MLPIIIFSTAIFQLKHKTQKFRVYKTVLQGREAVVLPHQDEFESFTVVISRCFQWPLFRFVTVNFDVTLEANDHRERTVPVTVTEHNRRRGVVATSSRKMVGTWTTHRLDDQVMHRGKSTSYGRSTSTQHRMYRQVSRLVHCISFVCEFGG